MTLLIALSMQTAQAACPAPAPTAADVLARTEDATLSFAEMDDSRFESERSAAESELPCLADVMAPDQAAAFHRMQALRAFMAGDKTESAQWFRASLRIQPQHELRTAIAPPDGPLAQVYSAARTTPADNMVAAPNVDGTLWVDGVRASDLPAKLPSIVQVTDASGGVRGSALVLGVENFPAGWVVEGQAVAPMPEPTTDLSGASPGTGSTATLPPREKSGSARKPLLISAIASGVVAAGLYGTSAAMRSGYENTPKASTRQTVNGVYFGSVGAAVLGVGLGTAGLIVK